MSLRRAYEAFTASPSVTALTDDAALTYLPTLTTVAGPEKVVKHLALQTKQLKKKRENVLTVAESHAVLMIEYETQIEFITSGGSFLPGLDDNFVTDHTIEIPMLHVVHFDASNKICSVRISWDQGSLLKQMDVIGSRGKNWPLNDGTQQVKLIRSIIGRLDLDARPTSSSSSVAPAPTQTSRSSRATSINSHGRQASLDLFAPQNQDIDEEVYAAHPVATRASAKPAPRNYNELFAGDSADNTPKGQAGAAPKAGGGKNFQPSRLFDTAPQDSEGGNISPQSIRSIKTDATKYNHFEFADGHDEPAPRPTPVVSYAKHENAKHASTWDFEDFTTPDRRPIKSRPQEERHFGWSDDEVVESPIKQHKAAQPRRDAETHFEFKDDGTPIDRQKLPHRSKGSTMHKGSHLYDDNLHTYNDEDTESTPQANKGPLKTVNNTAANDGLLKEAVSSQSSTKEDSPGSKENAIRPAAKKPQHQAAVKTMKSNWDMYDESPEPVVVKKPNQKSMAGGIRTTGNGMGGRKDQKLNWGFGDESEDEAPKNKAAKSGMANANAQSIGGTGGGSWNF